MQLLTPFDLIDQFPPDQTVVFVGNAPSLRGSGAGAFIESHDVVVRFNECAMADYGDDIGHRTDILVTNPYAANRTRPLLDGAAGPKVVLILNPQTRRDEREAFQAWVGDRPVLFSYTPDIKAVYVDRRKIAHTTGTYAVSLLPSLLKPRSTTVLGFTMFLSGADSHYWSDQVPKGIAAHLPEQEARVFIDLINCLPSGAIVGSDVAWVAERIGAKIAPGIQVRSIGWPQTA